MDPQKQEAFWRLWQERVEAILTMPASEMDNRYYGLRFSSEIVQIIFSCATGRKPIPNDKLSDNQLFGLFSLFHECLDSCSPEIRRDSKSSRTILETLIFRDGLSIRGFKRVILHDGNAEREAAFELWHANGSTLNTLEDYKDLFWCTWVYRLCARLQTTDYMDLTEEVRNRIVNTIKARLPLKAHMIQSLGGTFCQEAFCMTGQDVFLRSISRFGLDYYDWIETFKPEVLDLSD